jgi:hypothetical protein
MKLMSDRKLKEWYGMSNIWFTADTHYQPNQPILLL